MKKLKSLIFNQSDLHYDEETENECFAISVIDVEEAVIESIEFEEVLSKLDDLEKFVLMHKSYGLTDDEIKLGVCLAKVDRLLPK